MHSSLGQQLHLQLAPTATHVVLGVLVLMAPAVAPVDGAATARHTVVMAASPTVMLRQNVESMLPRRAQHVP